MQFRLPALSALGVLALGACADAPTAVVPHSSTPALASANSVRASVTGQYVVRFTGGGVPGSFAARVAELGGEVVSTHDGAGIAAVRGLSGATASQLAASAGVDEVQPDVVVTLNTRVAGAPTDLATLPGASDAEATSVANPAAAVRYGFQWNMRHIGADKAWAAGKLGSPDVKVAILDTGIDYDAFDLNGLVDLGSSASFIAGDDAITKTYFPGRHVISDYNGHGTNVATQVSSKARTFAGVTSKTTLMGVKVLDASGSGSFVAILNGLLWAADHGADVANMSLGGAFAKSGAGRNVATIARVLSYAHRKGMLVVAAAGNEAEDLDHDRNTLAAFCSEPNVLCVSSVGPVTATGNPDTPAYYTNFGRSSIDVAAPGGNAGDVLSTWAWGGDFGSYVWSYCSKTLLVLNEDGSPARLAGCQSGRYITALMGTSQATPHVAGLAALLVAEHGRAQPNLVKSRIKHSAVDLGQPGVDPYFGAGRISVTNALGL